MNTLVIILILLACLVLVCAVLAQNPKGGGLSSAFGGASASQFIGVQNTTHILEKITWGAATCIMILSVLANIFLVPNQGASSNPAETSPNVQEVQKNVNFLTDPSLESIQDTATSVVPNLDDLSLPDNDQSSSTP